MASLAGALVTTFLPSRCQLCGLSLPYRGSRAGICAACWQGVAPHPRAGCGRCGDPEAELAPCLSCRTDPPPFAAASSYGPYEGALRSLVLLLKHRHRDELAAPLGDLLYQAWERTGWPAPAAVVPVPAAWHRVLLRGFNQSALLARELATKLRVPLLLALRRRGAGHQVGLTRSARLRLAPTAFSARRPVTGRILLVDDVFTTGATATRCTRALLAAGAEEVSVLTLARTPNARRIP
ncbi:MAG: ComF family protein [Thermoanaerobaculaceae bacterium]|nr:ComF family protein [Thermoanaerobaculaceae bacterium]